MFVYSVIRKKKEKKRRSFAHFGRRKAYFFENAEGAHTKFDPKSRYEVERSTLFVQRI